jgi:hypothetical protein
MKPLQTDSREALQAHAPSAIEINRQFFRRRRSSNDLADVNAIISSDGLPGLVLAQSLVIACLRSASDSTERDHDGLMAHLIEPTRETTALSEYQIELAIVHDLIVGAARRRSPSDEPLNTWGASAKRHTVTLAGLHPWTGVDRRPLSELLNQMATVERLLDALNWAAQHEAREVLECHPTTSSGGHDLVVSVPDGPRLVVEVSDVAGHSGNENAKMTKDLDALLRCTCEHCAGTTVRNLATSPTSGMWLSKLSTDQGRMNALGISHLEVSSEMPRGTVITRIHQLPSHAPTPTTSDTVPH